MVYLQAEYDASPISKSLVYVNGVARRWWDGSPYLCWRSEISGYRTYRHRSAHRIAASEKSIAINEKSIVITDPKGKARRFFLKLWSVELHYSTPFTDSPASENRPSNYLSLRRRQEAVIQAFRFDEEKIKTAVRFLLEKRIPVKEYKNGRRVLAKKNKRNDFSKHHRPGF